MSRRWEGFRAESDELGADGGEAMRVGHTLPLKTVLAEAARGGAP